jgi:hypothetical protein
LLYSFVSFTTFLYHYFPFIHLQVSPVNMSSPLPVPIDRKKGIVSFSQFQLGRKAYSLFADNGSKVTQAIKPVIAKHATDGCGRFSTSWRNLSATQQAGLVSLTHEVEPRLLGLSEGDWITDWVLQKMIDQRVNDARRPSNKRKRARDGKPPKGTKRSKLVIDY